MQGNDRKFNDDRVVENLYSFLGECKERSIFRMGVTDANELLERLDYEELEKHRKILRTLYDPPKTFDNAKIMKKWQDSSLTGYRVR